jgi:Spy/CpxP family protein refolding chaperone
MFGFIFGTVCLIALFKVLRRSGRGWSPGWGYGGHGGWGHGRGHGYGHGGYGGFRGGARRWFLRGVFERLETTPGQEKAILAAMDELRENRRLVQDEAQQTRADLARAVSNGFIDDSTLEETFARHDRLLAQLRVAFVESLKKATEALDERQRKQVGDMLEGGRFGGGRIWA